MNQYKEAWERVFKALEEKPSWGKKQIKDLMTMTLIEVQNELLDKDFTRDEIIRG